MSRTEPPELSTPQEVAIARISRRRLLRLAARTAAGGVFLPLIGCRTGTNQSLSTVPPPPDGALPATASPWNRPSATPAFPLDLDALPATQPLPDLSDGRIVRRVSGIRPYRRGSYRLAHEKIGGKHLVHNYGHGGAGVTLSWGAAELAVEQLEAAAGPARRREAAVLGGGVVGLSTARVLQERGWRVTVYAEHFATDTTSNRAGAQFAPSGVAVSNQTELDDMVRRSAVRFLRLAPQNIGVVPRWNYTSARGGGALNSVPRDLLPSRTLDRLPFAGAAGNQPGRVHATFLIEPPRYLPWLLQQVRNSGGRTVAQRFAGAGQALRLPQPAIVNCLGLGAGDVFQDSQVQPIRGQLVHLSRQDLPYMISHRGYLFPRSDVVVLGGSYERGETQRVTTDEVCDRILRRHRAFFGVGA